MALTPPTIEVLYREEVQVSGSVSSAELLAGPVPTGKVWRLTDLGVENQHGTAAVALISIWRNGNRLPFDRLTTLVAATPQFVHRETRIPEGCYVSVLFTTIQATTDMLHVYLFGVECGAGIPELIN